MIAPIIPPDEAKRLEALYAYEVLNTPPESAFDDLTALAADICQAPIALISLIEEKRQWLKSKVGLQLGETPREISICGHAILQSDLFIVPDTLKDARFANNPLVIQEPQIRFYAGAPLLNPTGHALGTLCVIDREPRDLSPRQQEALRVLSRHVMAQLELRRSLVERHRMEGRLIQIQAQFRQLLATSPAVIYALKLEGNAFWPTWVSENIVSLTGFSPEEALQPTWWLDHLHPEDRDRTLMEQELVLNQDQVTKEYRFRCKDGRNLWIRDEQKVLRDSTGKPAEVIGSWHNVTDRKAAEAALQKLTATLEQRVVEGSVRLDAADKELAKRLRELQQSADRIREQATLLDKAQDAIVVRDLDQRITYWNQGAERLYGWTVQEAMGRSFFGLMLKGDVSAFQQACLAVLEEGHWSGELRLQNKSGLEQTVQSRWTLVRDGDGRAKSILDISTDITEKKLLEAKFLRAQRLESIGTLAGGVAHDLNNVLAPILMATDLLSQEVQSASGQKLLGTIKTSAERGAGMVKQVLSFARGAEGKRAVIQLKHLMTDLVKIAKETFPKSIRTTHSVAKGLWPILGDVTQLYQVLMNLCVNARDAMPDGGTLKIEAENLVMDGARAQLHPGLKPGPYVVITVSDTGTGIPPDIIDKIFDPFFTTKELGKGTGLGLSTAVGIVKSHGGAINVYSEVGKGTRFQVYLPAADPSTAETRESAPPDLPTGHGELILLVDDESAVREVAKGALETYGYKVLTASDGAEALGVYAEHRREIEVVVTDMMMPYLDGPAMIRVLQRMNPTVKLIATSGLVGNEKIAQLEGAKNIYFLLKPYDTEKLLKTLRQVIADTA